MKTIYLLVALVYLVCTTSHGQSLQDTTTLATDVTSILKDYPLKFHRGSSHWASDPGTNAIQGTNVFNGSAYIVYDELAPSVTSYEAIAEHICRKLRTLYHLGGDDTNGGRNQRSPTQANQYGVAYFVSNGEKDDPHENKDLFSLRVQVVALREAQIGIILSFVHVAPVVKAAE